MLDPEVWCSQQVGVSSPNACLMGKGREGPLGPQTPDSSFPSFVDRPNQGPLNCPHPVPAGKLNSEETSVPPMCFCSPTGRTTRLQRTQLKNSAFP